MYNRQSEKHTIMLMKTAPCWTCGTVLSLCWRSSEVKPKATKKLFSASLPSKGHAGVLSQAFLFYFTKHV